MLVRLLRPRWLAIHLAAILIAAGCATGAYWQFTAAREPARDAVPTAEQVTDPTELSEVASPGEYLPPRESNRGVSASGTFDPASEVVVAASSPDGEDGYNVVTALRTGDDTAIAVNRGWVAAATLESEGAVPPPPEGEVTVTGWLTTPQDESAGESALPDPPAEEVERIAPAILVNHWDYTLYDGYVTSAAALGGLAAPEPVETPEKYDWDLRNLSYSAQWALFAVVAIAFWITLMRREAADARRPVDAPAGR